MSADVIGFYRRLGVELPDNGRQASLRCPFDPGAHKHDDRNKSCRISLETGCYYCHACPAKGNPYQAAMALGLSSAEALRLRDDYGLRSECDTRSTTALRANLSVDRSAASRPAFKAPSDADIATWRRDISSPAVLERLYALRGWTEGAIRELRLGLLLDAPDLGLSSGRVVFVACDQQGQIVGVVRYQPNPDKRGTGPKTLALPGSRRELFPAPESIPFERPLLLVEGEADAVSAFSLGFAAVGIPGAGAWRPDWGSRFAGRHIGIVPDCDKPGRQLAADVARDVLAHAASVRVLDLAPDRDTGYDLGDLVREAAQDGHAALKQARAALARAIAALPPVPRPGQDIGATEALDEIPAQIWVPLLTGRPVVMRNLLIPWTDRRSDVLVTRCPRPRCGGRLIVPQQRRKAVTSLEKEQADADGLIPQVGCQTSQCWDCRRSGRLLATAAAMWGLHEINDRDELIARCSAALLGAKEVAA